MFLFSNAQSCFTVPELKALAFYEAALDGKNPSSCVMIGNDEFADIRGAMGAGMDACYIQTEQSPSFPISLPSPRISVLREIIE